MQAFGPLSARFRDAVAPRATDAEIAWLTGRIPADAGLVLDAMCGAGRVLVPLAAQGVKVHGVDLSSAMLARCEDKLVETGRSAPTFRQDVVQMNLPFRYGCAFVAGGAFQFITDPRAARAALERLRAHLVDPGLLFVEGRVPSTARTRLGAPLVEVRTVKLADESQIALRSEATWTVEARLAQAHNRYAHRRGATRIAEEHETVTSTWYESDELAELVRAAGFREVASGPAAEPIEDGDAFVVTARA